MQTRFFTPRMSDAFDRYKIISINEVHLLMASVEVFNVILKTKIFIINHTSYNFDRENWDKRKKTVIREKLNLAGYNISYTGIASYSKFKELDKGWHRL